MRRISLFGILYPSVRHFGDVITSQAGMETMMRVCAILLWAFMARGVLAEAAGVPRPLGPWSLRFALPPDHKPEWSAKGYTCHWKILWADKERPQVRIQDNAQGHYRGYVLVGRAFEIPQRLPAEMKVGFRYMTCCPADKPPFERSGHVLMLILTPEQWAKIADDPAKSEKLNLWRSREFAEYTENVHRGPQDAKEWTAWTSAGLVHALRRHAGKSLVFVMAWGAYHYHLAEWGAFDDFQFTYRTEVDMVREFFGSLKLDLPGLAQVKAAVEANDIASAKRSLVAYMKQRPEPTPPPIDGRTDPRSIAAADEIVGHVFRLVGCPPHELGRKIKWNEDPFDYDQWAIALNRHSHWRTLGRAYTGTKDEKYAREFVAQLTGWIDAMPVRIGSHWIQGVTPEATLSLDAGIRMGQTWFPAYYHFLHSPSFTVDAHVAMLRSFRDHALYLMDPRHFKHGSNWGMMELNGLYHIGVMLPEFREAETWRKTAIERMQGELDYQFYPDGAQTELTPGYHGVSVGNACGVLDLAKRTGAPLPDGMEAKLERTFEYYLRIMKPDRRTPALNDSGRGGVARWLTLGAQYFPHRDDFTYAATNGRQGRQPEFTSCRLDHAGWCVMRTGWTPEAKYLLLDAGPFGTGHQHEDKLHLIVHAFGRTVVTEPGTYSYDASDWRKYVLATRGHNTVLVDGMEQNRCRQRDTWRAQQPLADRWLTTPEVDYAEGTYSDGYGPKVDKTVTHTRRVLFVKPHYWIVIDELKPKDDKPHVYESLFHLDAATATVAPDTLVVRTDNPTGGNVAIVPLIRDGLSVDIVKGQTEPVVQGWLPTGKHNVLRPIPTAIVRTEKAGHALLAYAIVPFEAADLRAIPKVAPVAATGPSPHLAVRLEFQDRATHLVAFSGQTGRKLEVEGLLTDAEMALLAVGADGAPRLVFSLAGSGLASGPR